MFFEQRGEVARANGKTGDSEEGELNAPANQILGTTMRRKGGDGAIGVSLVPLWIIPRQMHVIPRQYACYGLGHDFRPRKRVSRLEAIGEDVWAVNFEREVQICNEPLTFIDSPA